MALPTSLEVKAADALVNAVVPEVTAPSISVVAATAP
jgi:hypothetical protein